MVKKKGGKKERWALWTIESTAEGKKVQESERLAPGTIYRNSVCTFPRLLAPITLVSGP